MTYKEILLEEDSILEKLKNRNADNELISRQEMIVKAIRKQVPVEVNKRKTRYECPICKSLFIGRPDPCCGVCGQRVKISNNGYF